MTRLSLAEKRNILGINTPKPTVEHRGGARVGAGRPRTQLHYRDDLKTIRIPITYHAIIKDLTHYLDQQKYPTFPHKQQPISLEQFLENVQKIINPN